MICGIYSITNTINLKKYIGQSVNIHKRWNEHRRGKTGHLYNSFKKYGIDNFDFKVICEVPQSALNDYEALYIKYYDTTNKSKGFNKTHGGKGALCTEETKEKMRNSQLGIPSPNKGKTFNETWKTNISKTLIGNTRGTKNKGKSFCDDHKSKISSSLKGKKKSPEAVANHRASLLAYYKNKKDIKNDKVTD